MMASAKEAILEVKAKPKAKSIGLVLPTFGWKHEKRSQSCPRLKSFPMITFSMW